MPRSVLFCASLLTAALVGCGESKSPQPSVFSEGPAPVHFWVELSGGDGRSRELDVRISTYGFDAEEGDLTVFVEGEKYCNVTKIYENEGMQELS